MVKKIKSAATSFEKLVGIMHELREKCPWDKKQTFETLRHLTIEETYELADAILEKDMKKIKQELGDLLLHIVFYSRLGEEKNAFTLKEVIEDICTKLIHRHPHIYGNVTVTDAAHVKRNWEKLKIKEGKKSVMEGVPVSLPAMVKAMRIQEKAKSAGFDWNKKEEVWEKVMEELNEFKSEAEKCSGKMEDEFGDLFFSLINYARFVNIDPESALEKTNKKFIRRFSFIEKEARKNGTELNEMPLDAMEEIWGRAKKKEK
ncbi:MAG: nucleoside triphosphate pyrophosphohydrolase [Bacteroidetes bacterium]|nr:nucleoside triphosphate pyrophosphohydrolase [Bacteroidota bacterium]